MTHAGSSSEPQTLEPVTGGRDFSSLPGIGMLPYAAGLIDGEGCIGISRSGERRSPSYAVRVDVGMTVKAKFLLDGLQTHLGGQVRRTRAGTEKWAEAWCWGLHGKAAAELLASLLPWIQLKREQAVLALAFQAEVDRWREESHRPNAPWPEWLREVGFRAWERNRELNAKGPAVAMSPQPIAYMVDGTWASPAASMFGERDAVAIPSAGCTQGGVVFALPMLGPATSEPGSSSLPTLPTPVAHDDGKSPEAHMAMKGRMPGGARDQITSLSVMARQAGETGKWDSALLPTPNAWDGDRGPDYARMGREDSGGDDLVTTMARMLPTPRSTRGGSGTETLYALGAERTDQDRPQGQVLLPTPSAADGLGGHERRGGARTDELLLAGLVKQVSTGEPTDPPSSDTPAPSVEQLRIL